MLKKLLGSSLVTLTLLGCSEENYIRTPARFNTWQLEAMNTSWFEVITYRGDQANLTHHQINSLRKHIAQTDNDAPLYARIHINMLKGQRHKLTETRVRSIRKLLQNFGIKNHRIDVNYLSPAEFASQMDENKHKITIVIDQYKLHIPVCDKVKELDTRHDDLEAAQGCATIRNHALMIAEPRDVYRAQEKAATNSTRQNLAVENYLTDKVKSISSSAATTTSSATK